MAGPDDRERSSLPGDERGLSPLASGYRMAEPYIGAAFSLVASVGAFAAGGYWLDTKVGNRTPWFLLLGALIGMVGGFIGFFRIVLGLNEKGRGSRR